MRPAQKRLDDLTRALGDARAALIEARAIDNSGTRETVGALADAEQIGLNLEHEMRGQDAVQRELQTTIEERERSLKVLRAAVAVEIEKRQVLEETKAVTNGRIELLRAKLKAERAGVAPLLERREKEVERLERRIAIVQAHKDARARRMTGLFPDPNASPEGVTP